MATLFSGSSINWSSSSWKVVDTTSYLYSEAGSTATTTSYVASANFMPGAITVEGILLRVKGTTTTPTGTFSVQLWNNTGSAQVAVVTCNAADIINNDTTYDGGWCYFKFAASQTLLAATNYQVRVLSSVAGTVTVYRNATAGNWSRGLVTSTTASLAASDDIIICGDITAAATTAINTVTFDNTAATSYGLIEVGAYGKILGQNSASTAYKLAVNNTKNFIVSHNGMVEFSSTGTRLPSTSSFVFTVTTSTAVNNGIIIRNYGTFRGYGTAKIRKAKLTADASVGATSLTTNVSTAWLSGDTIGLPNTAYSSGNEVKNLSANATGTTLTIAALTYAHGGNATTGVQADIINLTSNFQIYGTSTVNTYYIIAYNKATVDCDNVEFRYLGSSAGGKRGIELIIQAPTGSANLKDCVFRDFYAGYSYGVVINNFNGGVTIDGCVAYGTPNTHILVNQPLVTQTHYVTIQNNCFIGQQQAVNPGMINIETLAATNTTTRIFLNLINNTVAGGSCGYLFGGVVEGTISGNTAYSLTTGMYVSCFINSYSTATVTTFSNSTFWNNGTSINLAPWSYSSLPPRNVIFDTITSFSNTFHFSVSIGEDITFKNCSAQGGNTGVIFLGISKDILFDNCNLGGTSSYSSSVIGMGNQFYQAASSNATFRNCTISTGTLISNLAQMSPTNALRFQRFNSAGVHRVIKRDGTISNDSTIYDSASVSQRLTPNSASYKLSSSSFQVAVASGTTATISVKVRKSVIGDGTAYNGNQPRLILKANPSAHASAYNSDIVAATATNAANGAWETLSYTLPSAVTDNVGMEFYVDCDGTTGWVNVDTFVANNSMTYYMNGEPIGDASIMERSYSFIG